MRVLVVEDSPSVRRLLRRTVQALGHECADAEDGAAAWAYLPHNQVDVIISDWMMPKMSGLELCQRMRERPGAPYIYFAFVTGLGDQEHALEGVRSGADDYMVKPARMTDVERLLLSAARVIGLHRRRETLLDAAAGLAVQTDPDAVLRLLFDRALSLTDVVAASVYRRDGADNELTAVVERAWDDDRMRAAARRMTAEDAVAQRKTAVEGSFEPIDEDGSGGTTIAVPLIAEDRPVGALHVTLRRWRDQVLADEVGTFELLAGLAAATLVGVERSRAMAEVAAGRELGRLVGDHLANAHAALAAAGNLNGCASDVAEAIATARRNVAEATRRLEQDAPLEADGGRVGSLA